MVVSAFSLHYPNNSVEHPVSIMSQAYNHAPLSSDDEELSSSITVRTAAETHAFVMRMIANLGESLNRANTNCKAASREFSAWKEALKTTVACKTCGQLPRAPFILQCGHIHCFDCLKGHLESATRLFMTAHSRYQPPSEEYVQALGDPFRDPNLYLDAARWIRDNRTPSFQCTYCHEPLNRSPVHAFYLGSVICALDREVDTPTASSSNGDPWSKDFFDRYLLF